MQQRNSRNLMALPHELLLNGNEDHHPGEPTLPAGNLPSPKRDQYQIPALQTAANNAVSHAGRSTYGGRKHFPVETNCCGGLLVTQTVWHSSPAGG